TELLGLPDGEIADLHGGDRTVEVLLHHEHIDETDEVVVAQTVQLIDDRAGEVRLVEGYDEQLDGSDGHAQLLGTAKRCTRWDGSCVRWISPRGPWPSRRRTPLGSGCRRRRAP